MTVEMGILHRASGEYEVIQVASYNGFRYGWLPVAERLGLKLVAQFQDGALTGVADWQVPMIVDELTRLRGWAATQPDREHMAEKCEYILAAFARTDPTTHDYDFG